MAGEKEPVNTRQALPHSTPSSHPENPGNGPEAGACHSAVTPLAPASGGCGALPLPCPWPCYLLAGRGPPAQHSAASADTGSPGGEGAWAGMPAPTAHTQPSQVTLCPKRSRPAPPSNGGMAEWPGPSQALIHPQILRCPHRAFAVYNTTEPHERSKERQAGGAGVRSGPLPEPRQSSGLAQGRRTHLLIHCI